MAAASSTRPVRWSAAGAGEDLREWRRPQSPSARSTLLVQSFRCASDRDDTVMPVDALAIDAQHIARRFGRRWALADVTFQLRRGAVLMIAGHNGSGKTTLLRVLATLLRPDIGRATVGGFDVVKER